MTLIPDGPAYGEQVREGVSAAFEGVQGGDEILPRLLEVYKATSEGWQREDTFDGYFSVRNPAPITATRAIGLLRLHLDNLVAMSEAVGCDELTGLLRSPLRLEAVEGETPWPPGDDDPETLIHDVTCRFMESLTPRESAALLMGEAFWTIACDSNLQNHILWPLYRHATPIEEPFQHYFDLWKHGAGFRFADERAVRVYVPEGKRGAVSEPGRSGGSCRDRMLPMASAWMTRLHLISRVRAIVSSCATDSPSSPPRAARRSRHSPTSSPYRPAGKMSVPTVIPSPPPDK